MLIDEIKNNPRGYLLAVLLGAVGGGLIIALGTKAVPKIMRNMMKDMMSSMTESGCDPAET